MYSNARAAPRPVRPPTFDPERAIVFDVETYPGRWMVGFLGLDPTGRLKPYAVETTAALAKALKKFAREGKTLCGYNSEKFDVPVIRVILTGVDPFRAAQSLIKDEGLPQGLAKLPEFPCDHVDLSGRLRRGKYPESLKVIAGRIGMPRLRELPFEPGSLLTDEQWAEVGPYNRNDLDTTWAVMGHLAPELDVLAALTEEYGPDLRSLPSSQVVERVFLDAYREANGGAAPVRWVPGGEVWYRPVEGVMRPRTPEAAAWYDLVTSRPIPMLLDARGRPKPRVPRATFRIGSPELSLAGGGLHSLDKPHVHYADDSGRIVYLDVASYYPSLIATRSIAPESYGEFGGDLYRSMLEERLRLKSLAKAAEGAEREVLTRKADGLKLMLNSFFGKLGDPGSTLYDPSACMAVTISGQLMLIDLVERLEGTGLPVLSVNTDGLFVRVPSDSEDWRGVLDGWQRDTRLTLEVEALDRLAILATNRYAYVTSAGKVKRAGDGIREGLDARHSAEMMVLNDALANALLFDVPPERTIFARRDLVSFCGVACRTPAMLRMELVEGETRSPLPAVTRWYRARKVEDREARRIEGTLLDKKRGVEVARKVEHCDHVAICQDMPDSGELPPDLDRAWYLGEARKEVHAVPGYRHRDPRLVPANSAGDLVLARGLVPIPKDKKGQPIGSSHKHPSLLYDWSYFETAGCYTGPEVATLVVDVDEPDKFRAFIGRRNSEPLLGNLWDSLAGSLVSYHGAATAEGVRSGKDRGKLIFTADLGPDHPLCRCPVGRWKEEYGIEVFYGKGAPSILGRYGDDGDAYRLDGTLTEAPPWLVEALASKAKARRTKVARKVRSPKVEPEERLEAQEGLPAKIAASYPEFVDRRWDSKDLGEGKRIQVTRCPGDHRAGNDSDFHCGVGEDGREYVECKHPTCTLAPRINQWLGDEWRRDHPPLPDPPRVDLPPVETRIVVPEPGGNGQASKPRFEWIKTDYATLADAECVMGAETWAWELWVQIAALAAVVADAGLGKTFVVTDWCWRLWEGLPMPDGTPNPFPKGTKTLWLLYDRNWHGLIRNAKGMGLPREAILLPTHKKKPLWLPDFDDPRTMDILREFIDVHRPGYVIIDLTTYASAYNTGKPNESKIAFDPIMDVLMEKKTAGIGITHTNTQGGILNRRMLERVRTKIEITRPDPEQAERMKIECTKTDFKKPPALGAEIVDNKVVYDHSPPEVPAPVPRGRKPSTSPGLAEFLWQFLEPKPAAVVDIVKAARDKGLLKSPTAETPKPSISPLYDARDWVERLHPGKTIEESSATTDAGKTLKFWGIVDKPAPEEGGDPDVPF
jgi:hypothetical protein